MRLLIQRQAQLRFVSRLPRVGHIRHRRDTGENVCEAAPRYLSGRQVERGQILAAVKLHDLRHFYASGLIAAGCDVVTVQRALGHASATVTLNTYAHLWPTAEDRTRAAAAAMLADTLGGGAADSVRTSGQI